jgi:hypothetical protein
MSSQPNLVEHEDHWELLPLVGRAVTRCLVDHAFALQFWSPETEFELRIEGPFTLRQPDGEELSLMPEETPSLGPALRLLRREVSSARAHKDGRLEVLFSDGSSLSVGPDQHYEAWELAGSGQRLVSTPGGDLAVWL